MTKNKTQKLINKKNIKNKKGAGFWPFGKKTTGQQPPKTTVQQPPKTTVQQPPKTTVQQLPINYSFVGTPKNPTRPNLIPKSVHNTVVNFGPVKQPKIITPPTTLQQPSLPQQTQTTLQQPSLPQKSQTTETKKSWFPWGIKKEENKDHQSQITYFPETLPELNNRIKKQGSKKNSFYSRFFTPKQKSISQPIAEQISQSIPQPLPNQKQKQTFEIYWVRHANSCANMLESYGAKGLQDFMYGVTHLSVKTKRGTYTPDPHITNFGISHANLLSTQDFIKNIQPDIICVSQLLRTWETAYTLFPQYFSNTEYFSEFKNQLYVCPWINEKRENMFGTNLDNEPDLPENTIRKFDEFKEYLVETFGETFTPNTKTNINYINRNGDGLLDTQINKQTFIKNYKTPKPDYNNFIEKILPYLYKEILKFKPNAKIVIVTHSKFIQKNITKVKDKQYSTDECVTRTIKPGYPRNCDIYKQTYNVTIQQNKSLKYSLKQINRTNVAPGNSIELQSDNRFSAQRAKKNESRNPPCLAVQVNPPSLDQNYDVFELLTFTNLFKPTNNYSLDKLKEDCYNFFTEEMNNKSSSLQSHDKQLSINSQKKPRLKFNVDSKENINSLLIQAVAKIIRIIDNNNQENMINKNKYIKYLFFKLKNYSVNPKMQVIEHSSNFMQLLENSKNFQLGVNSNNVNFNIYKNLIDFIMNNQIFWNISLGLCNDKDKSYQNNVIKYFKSHPELYKKIINKIKENVYGKIQGLEPSNNPIIMNKLLYDILKKLDNNNNDLFIRFNRSESINNRINNQQILQTPQIQPVNNFRNIIGVEPATEVTEIREVVEQPRSNNNKIAGKIIYYKDFKKYPQYPTYEKLIKRYYYKRNKPTDVFFYLDKRSFDSENYPYYPTAFTNPSFPKHNLNTSSIVNEVILKGNIKTIDDFIKNKNTSRYIEMNNFTPRIVPIENYNENVNENNSTIKTFNRSTNNGRRLVRTPNPNNRLGNPTNFTNF